MLASYKSAACDDLDASERGTKGRLQCREHPATQPVGWMGKIVHSILSTRPTSVHKGIAWGGARE